MPSATDAKFQIGSLGGSESAIISAPAGIDRFDWVTVIADAFQTILADRPTALIASHLTWYPIAGDNKTAIATDILIAFDRPKGSRSSYRQYYEDGIAPTIVFDVLPSDRCLSESFARFHFFERFGVEEYYHYDPHSFEFSAWVRDTKTGTLASTETTNGYISPRLGVLFVPRPETPFAIFSARGRPVLDFQYA